MRLASINLNKRLGNPSARTKLTAWLHRHQVDVLVAQEPWKPVDRSPVSITGFRAVDGDGDLCCWIAEQFATPPVSRPDTFVQRLELAWLVVCNTYLDCGSTVVRGSQLGRLRKIMTGEPGRPSLVCGDFNLAPRPVDGLYDGRPSTFNSATDRTPLAELLADTGLVDATATDPPQFTIERQRSGVSSQFRCDLVLAPDHLLPGITVRYDHTTRIGELAFTDHSGILVDVPVTLDSVATDEEDTLLALPETGDKNLSAGTQYKPHKTAMSRARPSPSARAVVDVLVPAVGIASVLDHGCGRGSDIDYYRAAGLFADGWDPHPGFGWTAEPARQYDLVVNVFVLNVLADPWQRIQALRNAARFARPGGHLLVVTRSPADIDPRAASANWTIHHDGYWSSKVKGTFQKGISVEEIAALARRAGLTPAKKQMSPAKSSANSQVLLVKIALGGASIGCNVARPDDPSGEPTPVERLGRP